jgi:hypothetical protein
MLWNEYFARRGFRPIWSRPRRLYRRVRVNLTEINEMSEVRKRYLYAAITSHPLSLMTADPKELLAWLFYLDE